MLRKVSLEVFECVELSFAAPEGRWTVSRRRRVAFEFDILRLQLGVQDHLQVSAGHKSQWKRRSALRATLATPYAGEAGHESAVRGADDRDEQKAFANAAGHEVFLRDDLCGEGFVRICDGVEHVETRARAH